MARTVRAEVEGVQSLLTALKAMGDGVDRELTTELQAAAEPIAAGARRGMRRGEGPRANAKNPSDRLPHIADTIYATAAGRFAQIVSPHPAAVVFEYGGSIRPRSRKQRIDIPELGMAHKAADAALPDIERDLERRLDALAARLGL
jgi:hypothetical protein